MQKSTILKDITKRHSLPTSKLIVIKEELHEDSLFEDLTTDYTGSVVSHTPTDKQIKQSLRLNNRTAAWKENEINGTKSYEEKLDALKEAIAMKDFKLMNVQMENEQLRG